MSTVRIVPLKRGGKMSVLRLGHFNFRVGGACVPTPEGFREFIELTQCAVRIQTDRPLAK